MTGRYAASTLTRYGRSACVELCLQGESNELCFAIAKDLGELGGSSRAKRPSILFEITQMLPRDLELSCEIGLAHVLAQPYRSQHFGECKGTPR